MRLKGEKVHMLMRGVADEEVTVDVMPVPYTLLRAHETLRYIVWRLLLEKKKKKETH